MGAAGRQARDLHPKYMHVVGRRRSLGQEEVKTIWETTR